MVGNLVIVESPGKVPTIQKYLGEGYTVKASIGHIRDLEKTNLSIDVENGFKPQYVVPSDKKKVVSELKKLSGEAQTVYLASDEDREGEAISWHLYETLGLDPQKTKRIVFHEITKNAILEAIKNPRGIDMNLVDAQQARRVLDRLVGFELSPVLWRKVKPKLSAGRVQSVALRLIVDREKEIMAFEGKQFYKVDGEFTPSGEKVPVKATLDTKFNSKEEAFAFLEESKGAIYKVADTEEKNGSRYPGAPFTTSTLQQEAARILHYPVSTTMRIAQGLYERGLITYMRTDSTTLSTLALGSAKEYILKNFGENYLHTRQYKTKVKGAQEAHEAIRPTYIANASIEGSPQEQKLYSLIWRRTVASQMSDASILTTSIKISSSKRKELFISQNNKVVFDGFLKIYNVASEDEDENLSVEKSLSLKKGDILDAKKLDAQAKFTPSPSRYSEGTLVKELEKREIGRPSTYATIISTLTTGRGYVIKGDKAGKAVKVENFCLKGNDISSSIKEESVGAEKGKLLPQEIGMIVSDFLSANFPDIMDYDFTAKVETDFDHIAEGSMKWNDVIGSFYAPFHEVVEKTTSSKEYSHVEREIGVAPDGEVLIAKFGQYGPYVQKGPAEKRQYASLNKGMLIESLSIEDALKLFALPRTVGTYEENEIRILSGRFGPYIKFGDKNITLPKSADPLKVSIEECINIIDSFKEKTSSGGDIARWEKNDIAIINGRYGPYIKHAGSNYKIPKGTDAAALNEEDCLKIISSSSPTSSGAKRRFRK